MEYGEEIYTREENENKNRSNDNMNTSDLTTDDFSPIGLIFAY